MKYKIIEKGNPLKPTAPKKFYANAVNAGKITMRDVAKEIEGRSSLTRGDIENVLINFLELIPSYLKQGFSVQMSEFATLRLNLSSEGVEDIKKFTGHNIKGTKVIFTPSTGLKNALNDIKFEKE